MKIKLISDLHTEFHQDAGMSLINNLPNNCDVLVVAGDLSVGEKLLKHNITQLCYRFAKVIYVAGNHDFYHSSFRKIESLLSTLNHEIDNFYWLENKRIVIDGQGFVGATLWFKRTPDTENYNLQKHLNDFNCIDSFRFYVFEKHEKTIQYFKNNIQSNDIVVTHHAPSFKCIEKKYAKNLLNCFFATNIENIIKKTNPKYCFHGHGHGPMCTKIYNTEIYSNPFGYPNEQIYNKVQFDEFFIVTV